jgi:aminoglycoside/choline kinase family phosphotransferase
MLSEATQLSLLEYYAARSAHPDVARRTFWPAALQRLGQALGAYAKLGSQPDTASFAEYIPPALKMLRRALAHTPTIEALKHLIEKQ